MKNLMGLSIILSLFLSDGAFALNERSALIERRLNGFLSTYLEPHEFLVVVEEIPASKERAVSNSTVTNSLPGTPGLTVENPDSLKYNTYFDLNGQLAGGLGRPPIHVRIILHRSIPNETRSLLRRMIPSIAGLDTKYGDKMEFRTGNIESPARKRYQEGLQAPEPPKQENAIETLLKHKRELIPLGLGLLSAIGILILINGILAILREKQKKNSEDEKQAPGPSAPPMPTFSAQPLPLNNSANSPSTRNPKPGRDELYSRDEAFHGLVEEIRQQAEAHPERIAELIRRWLQSGEVGVRKAATLLQNFSFKIVERIMDQTVPSDLDHLRKYTDLEFDFFSPQNTRVVMEARQELMKIVASANSQQRPRGFEFLAKQETQLLIELFRDEPVRHLVLASAEIPAHRLAEIIANLPPETQSEYFVELCKIRNADAKEINAVQMHFAEKMRSFNQLLLTESQKVESMATLVRSLPFEEQKMAVLQTISREDAKIYAKVRGMITLFDDIRKLPDRALKMLISDEDPVIVARAFSREAPSTQTRVFELLPKSSQEIFSFEIQNPNGVGDHEYRMACSHLVAKIDQMIYEGVISSHDISREAMAPDVSLKRVA